MANVTKLSLVAGMFPAPAYNSISIQHNDSNNSEMLREANASAYSQDILALVNELTKAIELLEATVRQHGREIKRDENLQGNPTTGKHFQAPHDPKPREKDKQLPLHIFRNEKVCFHY